jgi:hypothetical protein
VLFTKVFETDGAVDSTIQFNNYFILKIKLKGFWGFGVLGLSEQPRYYHLKE